MRFLTFVPTRRALLSVAFVMSCMPHSGPTDPLGPGNNVLFIGNSLTYENDLPGVVLSIANAGGVALQARTLALPNRALIDYVIDGSARSAIAQGGWKYIVMQQGPTTIAICRDTMVIAVRAINAMGLNVGAKSVVMMSWPSTARPNDFAAAALSARMAAQDVGGLFAPAGNAWQLALLNDPNVPLYGADGYHPAPAGTLLAAFVLYEKITGRDARALPTSLAALGLNAGLGAPLSEATVAMMQRAAHEANASSEVGPVTPWSPTTPPVPAITC